MTTLEKTRVFENLPLSYFNKKYGVYLIVLYIIIGKQRFVWAVQIWCGKGERSWVDLALSSLYLFG
jgi:hypothetical protein